MVFVRARPEKEQTFSLPHGARHTVEVYTHDVSGLMCVFVQSSGPLCTAAIVVPTSVKDDRGLPHTLEHLCFTGSHRFPHRGYLDCTAIRSLSTGTNAWTDADSTCYTINTAGSNGLKQVLPVFLDHVLHPVLGDEHFITEVYHVDGQGKRQGVVYCEMKGREQTEADLLDYHLRQSLYGAATTYSFECGGKPAAIQTLTPDDIREYHAQHYTAANAVICIVGDVQSADILTVLEQQCSVVSRESKPLPASASLDLSQSVDTMAKTVSFPSSDESTGSIAYGWRGPPSTDVETLLALDVLFRLLHDTAASPLYQRFVELDDPLASSVDYDQRSYISTSIVLQFSGVPNPAAAADEDGDSDDNDDDDLSEDESDDSCGSGDDEEEEDDDEEVEEMDPAEFYEDFTRQLRQTLQHAYDHELTAEGIRAAIERHRMQTLSTLEEDFQDSVIACIVPDIVALKMPLAQQDRCEGELVLGGRAGVLDRLQLLGTKPLAYWRSLMKTWVLDNPMAEVRMVPSCQLAQQIAQRDQTEELETRQQLGAEGLKACDQRLQAAKEANAINLPAFQHELPDIAPIDDLTRVPGSDMITHTDRSNGAFPYVQTVRTRSFFVHLRLALPLSDIPLALRPYIVLLQELLFDCDLDIPAACSDTGKAQHVPYTELSLTLSKLCTDYEASCGLGNDVFSSSSLADTFFLAATSPPEHMEASAAWLVKTLMFSTFTADRIKSVGKNLLSDIADWKRDGEHMCTVITRAALSAADTKATAGLSGSLWHRRKAGNKKAVSGSVSLELHQSLLTQEPFLKALLRKPLAVTIDKLNALRRHIVTAVVGQNDGPAPFMQLVLPLALPADIEEQHVARVRSVWQRCSTALQKDAHTVPRKRKPSPTPRSPFPFPRTPCTLSKGQALLVPMKEITASYLRICTPYLLQAPRNPDLLSVMLLCELLSRNEGPLYTLIRGQGYAYDCSMYASPWKGYLSLDCSECSSPVQTIREVRQLVQQLLDQDKAVVNDFERDMAKACLVYRSTAGVSTAEAVATEALRSALKGYASLADQRSWETQMLQGTTSQHLLQAASKYFGDFLDPKSVMSVPGTVVYFVGYDRLRGYFARTMAPENVSYAPFVAGIIARSLAASIVSPVELVRTRMQTKEASGKSIQEVLSAVRAMTRQRGITYLWRGLSPTLWRDVPFSGIYWYCYESFKGYFGRKLEDAGVHTGVLSSNFSVPFLAGASAGILAATVTTPFDVAKTRRQISTASQPVILVDRFFDPSPATTSFATASASSWSTRSPPSNPVPVYSAPNTASSFLYDTNGVWTILRHIWQTEGASGLLRGLAPRVIKVAPSCAIMVSSYEFGKQIFEQGIPYNKLNRDIGAKLLHKFNIFPGAGRGRERRTMNFAKHIVFERQEGALCAQHCLNTLLQGHYFTALDLAEIARGIDAVERSVMAERGTQTREYREFVQQDSQNYDDTGFFSVEVLRKALEIWNIELVSAMSSEVDQSPEAMLCERAYICNLEQHWLTLRRFDKQWYNLNSTLKGPTALSETYLPMLITQLKAEGYTIFVARGQLPTCPADQMAVAATQGASSSTKSGKDTGRRLTETIVILDDDEPPSPQAQPAPASLASVSAEEMRRRRLLKFSSTQA
ncbi:hypothetical protein RI367_002047 [Sorochytrium milnesiophthora]